MATLRNTPHLKDRLVSAAPVEDDSSFELKLRPQRLAEFIGQDKVKENLAVAIEAARSRGEAMDHVLLYGPPGLGKTTLANIIANELGTDFSRPPGRRCKSKAMSRQSLRTCAKSRSCSSTKCIGCTRTGGILYSALEDYKLDIIIGQGPSARTHTMDVKPFTFVGATTRAGLLSAPLRSRFGLMLRLEFYTDKDLQIIVERSAEILGVGIDKTAHVEIASRVARYAAHCESLVASGPRLCPGSQRAARSIMPQPRPPSNARGGPAWI